MITNFYDKKSLPNNSSDPKPLWILLSAFTKTGKDTFATELRKHEFKKWKSYHLYGRKNSPVYDTFLNILHGKIPCGQSAFADALKIITHEFLGFGPNTSPQLFENKKDTILLTWKGQTKTPREWYKYIAEDKRKQDPLVFVRRVVEDWNGTSHMIITDLRLTNELPGIQELIGDRAKVVVLRLYRSEVPHPSIHDVYETSLINLPADFVIVKHKRDMLKEAVRGNYPWVKQDDLMYLGVL
jgi:hypothetical protein